MNLAPLGPAAGPAVQPRLARQYNRAIAGLRAAPGKFAREMKGRGMRCLGQQQTQGQQGTGGLPGLPGEETFVEGLRHGFSLRTNRNQLPGTINQKAPPCQAAGRRPGSLLSLHPRGFKSLQHTAD